MPIEPGHDESTLRQYLLGAPLPENVVDEIEQNYFAEDPWFERLQGLEDRLVEQYLAGELSELERGLFEKRKNTSPHLQQKCDEQQRVHELFRNERSEPPAATKLIALPPSRFLPLAVAAMVICGAALYVAGTSKWRDADTRQSKILPLPPNGAGAVAVFVLSPGMLRGPGSNIIEIPSAAQWVTLQLRTDPTLGSREYEVTVRTADGDLVWAQGRVEGRPDSLSVTFPSGVLKAGDYVLSLVADPRREKRALASYAFHTR